TCHPIALTAPDVLAPLAVDARGGVLMLFPLVLPAATTTEAGAGHGHHDAQNGHGDATPKPRSPLGRLIDLLRLERRDIVYIYVYTIAVGVLGLVLPLGVQALISFMSGGLIGTSIVVLVGLIIASTVISGLLQVQQISLVEVLQRRVFARTALDFARRLPRVEPTAGWNGEYPPEVVNRFFDVLNVQKGLPKLLIDISASVLQVLFGLLVLSFYHPFFIFFSIVLVLSVYLIVQVIGPKGLKTSITESKYKYRTAFWLEEMGRALPAFRLAPHGTLALQKTDALVAGYLHYRKEHFKVLMQLYGYAIGFRTLVVGGLLILATVLLAQGQITLGQIVASELIIVLIVAAVEKLILSLDVVYDLLTALDKLGHVTDKPLEEVGGLNPDLNQGLDIEFRGVSTFYPLTRRRVARHADLRIEPTARLGLTSADPEATVDLCRTLLGQLPYEGTILINGLPMPNLDREGLRRLIGETVTQTDIFAGTALENIILGRPGIGTTHLRDVLAGLGLDELVTFLPRGLDTELVPADPALPDVLVMKLLLARAVIDSPRLLLLRDPVSLEPHDHERTMRWLLDAARPWAAVVLTDAPTTLALLRTVAEVREGRVSAPVPVGASKQP
ncbi:MAG: hypothetical protein H7330_03520, partial [Hymenobacteraceae bacterium]|nr:hypothetical protein [Hymenobacteraceae bacterium]